MRAARLSSSTIALKRSFSSPSSSVERTGTRTSRSPAATRAIAERSACTGRLMKRATRSAITNDAPPVAATMYACVRSTWTQSGRMCSGSRPATDVARHRRRIRPVLQARAPRLERAEYADAEDEGGDHDRRGDDHEHPEVQQRAPRSAPGIDVVEVEVDHRRSRQVGQGADQV